MVKTLNGTELASFIKERQAKQVRGLRQAEHIAPRLAIVRCDEGNPVIDTYVRLKKAYGQDILIEVDEYQETPETVKSRIAELAGDESVHGIIVQLPVQPADITEELLELVPPHKDVDGLASESLFDPATPMAISWLLTGYGIEPRKHSVAIVGQGRLVGAPLARMWLDSQVDVTVFTEENSQQLQTELPKHDIIVAATGSPGVITNDMIRPQAIVVDAGTASEDGVIKGDVASEVHERADISITPTKGGVGPLTVAALFDNVIRSARRVAETR